MDDEPKVAALFGAGDMAYVGDDAGEHAAS
jgi:hypothetical protein